MPVYRGRLTLKQANRPSRINTVHHCLPRDHEAPFFAWKTNTARKPGGLPEIERQPLAIAMGSAAFAIFQGLSEPRGHAVDEGSRLKRQQALLHVQRKGWALDGLGVRVTHSKGSATAKDRFVCELELGNATDEQRERLLSIAQRCPVDLVLERGGDVPTTVVPDRRSAGRLVRATRADARPFVG